MSSKPRYILIALSALALWFMAGAPLNADVTGRPHDLTRSNPKGHCLNCHDLHQTGLGQGYAHNLKRANEMAVCYQCHAGALNDYSSIDPSYKNITGLYSHYDIRSEFSQQHIHFPRYGMDGEHNKCSYCHNPHGVFNHASTTRKPKLLSAGPDVVTDTDEFCFVCHNSDPNPPHTRYSNISVGGQYQFSRTNYKQMTHSTFYRATTVTEPVPDTARTYDDNPYGKGKDISCLTCHRPHGSPNDHMLKAPDDQELCLACHNGSKAPALSEFKTTGHGKAGVGRICQECHFPHGTGQENAIKKTISDPHTLKNMTSDVNGKGMNEACFACHGQGGSTATTFSFDSSLTGWYSYYTNAVRDTATYYLGGASMKFTTASPTYAYSYSDLVTVQPNTTYTFSAFLYLPAALTTGSSYITVNECNSSGTGVRNTNSTLKSAATGRWERQTLTLTTTSSTASVRIYLYHTGGGTAYWDEVQIMSASDKPYYAGKAAYSAGIHKTSTAAHNPGDTAGDQAAGDCDNCHNPHGKGYSKMTVDPDQTLCYDCHNATTPNTKSGRDVQGSFQSASHHDLTKVRCASCHNVHKATQYQVMADPYNTGVLMSDKTVFCLSCHSGSMPSGVTGAPNTNSEWANGGHDTTHALGCPDCHDPHGSPNPNNLNFGTRTSGGYTALFAPGMSFSSRAFCEACHNRAGTGYKGAKKIPTGAGYVGQHDQSDPTSCSTCHAKKHNPTVANYTGTSSFYTTACLDCHTQGKSNPYPNADAEFNTPANGTDANTRKSIHDITYSPPSTVDCTACHGANHETDHSATRKVKDPDRFNGMSGIMPSIQTSSVFCLECHDKTPVSIGGNTPPNIMDTYTGLGHGKASAGRTVCYACHEYHGSTNEKLIKTVINGSAVMSNYSGNNVTVCTACHRQKDASLPMWPGYSVYSGSIHAFGNPTTGNLVGDGRHGPGVCVNCHNPHGAKVDGVKTRSMLNKNGEDLCYTCHASGFDNFSTAGDYNNKWNRIGSALTIKKENKALHMGRNVIGRGIPVLDGLDTSYPIPDKDCTISVRLKVSEFTRSDGAEQVGISIYDPRDFNKFVNLFYCANDNPRGWEANDSGGGLTKAALFGDESTTYHTLKLVRKRSSNQVDAYIDNTFVRTCQFAATGSTRGELYAWIDGNNDSTPEALDAWFDDFKVAYASDGSAHTTSSGDDVQARFYMKSHHKISDADQLGPDGLPGTADDSKVECTDCHDPHTITERLMAFKETSGAGGKSIVPEEADQHFCLKCHNGAPPQGVKFPADGVWDKSMYVQSAHGNPLKRNRTFGNYSNGVSYACKVCHNPHGSDQAALQRESWDINRDGLPDDIDGDGVLDSTSMVGYIGYSTGTRKPMLVKSPRPGFQRVSSTIPYQANGTIDVELCLNCHDGSPAPDVKDEFDKLSHHDVTYADQQAHGGSKIECYNCHDQHRAQARDDAAGDYPTTNPDPPREPMPGDAQFCLRCHDNTLPAGVSFGALKLKNVKLSYNPYNRTDANGYDVLTSYMGHYEQTAGAPLMCRECHNQHGSSYSKLLRDDTEPSKPGYNSSQNIQGIQPVALRRTDVFSSPTGAGDDVPLSSTPERCLACHSGATTYKGGLIPVPPPPDSAERGFTMSPVGKHPDLKPEVTLADESNGHIYKSTFAVITTPGSVKDSCTVCHDSHNPYIATIDGQLMDCYRCHNENTSLPDVQSEFNDNPTNPSRSKSIHPIKFDPTGTTPYYVECLKCHDQTKHMQGHVRLRKDPSHFVNYTSDAEVWTSPVSSRTVNQFCLECHGPGTAVASSFWRGGTEHVPPKLPAGHVNGAHFVNGTLLCTDCHEYHGSKNLGLRKNARGDEETFCYSCHSDPAKSKDGVNVQSKFIGTASHHQVAKTEQGANGTKVECEDCHNPHVVTRPDPVVNVDDKNTAVPSDRTFCIGCHDSGGAAGVKFPGFSTGRSAPEWNTSTGKWNRWDKGAYAGSSHDVKGVECLDCHDPHGSPNYDLLLQNISSATGISVRFGTHSTIKGKRKEELGVNRVCAACHKSNKGVYEGYANFTGLTFGKHGVDKNCTYCHNPHGTAQAKLIRSDKPLYMNMTSSKFGSVYNFKGFGNHTTGAPAYLFCSSAGCHVSERSQFDTFNMDLPVDNFDHRETSSSHHPLKEGVVICTSCHKEHGSSMKATDYVSPDLRATFFRGSNWPQTWHSGRGVYSTSHTYGGGFDGSDYYEPGPPAPGRGQVTTVTPPDNANDLCFMCHQKDDIIGDLAAGMAGTNTKFLGHEAVKGGAKVSHNISRDVDGTSGDYHSFSCSACHFPHSSTQGKLLKTGCFSQSDNQYPSSNEQSAFVCHAFTKWANYNAGWRNLTTAGKNDFKRPPNAVADLAASSDADLTVHLNWTAVADQPGQGAHHYNIYRYTQTVTQATKPYATRMFKGLAGGAPGAATSWTDYTGQPDTTYYYAVVACDSENNESFVSNCASVSLGADTVKPAAISDQQTSQVDGYYKVKMTWHDPGDNVNVTQYKVYRIAGLTPLSSGDIIETNRIATVTDTSLSADGSADGNLYSYTDTAPTLGQSFSYAVVALDAAGNASSLPTGSTFSVTVVDPAPASVTTLTGKPVSLDMKARLDWAAPTNVGNISGYNVYRKAGSGLVQSDLVPGNIVAGPVSALNYTDTVPSTAVDYYYTVTAIDESSGKESSLGNCVLVNVPAPPGGTACVPRDNRCLQISWNAPSYATGLGYYKLYARRNGGAWAQVTPSDNLVPFGSFENGMDSWTMNNIAATGLVSGLRECVKLTTLASGDNFIEYANMIPVQPSASYVYTGYVYIPAALTGGGAALRVIEYNSSSSYVTEHTATAVTTTSGWQKLTDTWTTNASTTKVKLRLQLAGVGTAYWDDLTLSPSLIVGTSARVDTTGLEPGTYDYAATSNYGIYGGVTPYESVMSAPASATVTDTSGPADMTPSSSLISTANTNARLAWTAPADRNYAGYTPAGMSYYRVQASYDNGNTWGTVIKSRLANPSLEAFTGTADDATTDTFPGWSGNNAGIYAVTDALFDGKAMNFKTTGANSYVFSAEPDTSQAIANKPYSMSFWAKASRPGVGFSYCIQANGGGLEQAGFTNATAGTQWQRYTAYGVFAATPTVKSAMAAVWAPTDPAATLTIDGVRLDSGTAAQSSDDGTFYQPSGYDTQGSAQGMDDPKALNAGTAERYRVQAVDAQGNVSSNAYTPTLYAKPSQISDLKVSSLTGTSGNALYFSTPATQAGLVRYKVYAKLQATPITDLTGATLIGTTTPAINHGGNIAGEATASASQTYAYAAYNINDGNAATYWDGMYGATPNSVTLTFGSAVPVYRVSFMFHTTIQFQPKDFLVQTNDGSGWVTQVTVTGNTDTNPAYAFAKPVSATQVRIYITDTRGGLASYRPIIYEFQVYPGDSFVHDLQNTYLQAEAGRTYAYAVLAEDVNNVSSDMSTGSPTVNAVLDKTAPDKVNDLAVTSAVGSTTAVLTWKTPLDNLGHGTVTGATSYEIYQLPTSSVGTPAAVTDDNFATASLVTSGTYASGVAGTDNSYTATWYDHKGVYYAVRSADSAGNWSKMSNSPYVIVGKDVQAPTPPIITECRPVTSPEVDAYWTPAVDNVDINGYRLFRADTGLPPFDLDGCITENNIDQAQVAVNLIPYNASSASDTGGTPGKTYYYAMRAWDSDNNMSNISNCVSATVRTTGADSTAPIWTGSPLSASQQQYPDIDLIWTPATDKDNAGGNGGIDHYDVYRGTSGFTAVTDPGVVKLATVSGVRKSYVDNTGVPDTTYYYGVVPVDASAAHNAGVLSNIVSATVASKPSPDNVAPTLPVGVAASTGVYPLINLSWTASTDVDDASNPLQILYYKLYRADYPLDITDANKDIPAEVTTVIVAHDAVSYVARGTGGSKYNYRLEAFDLAGNRSGLSAQVMGQVASAPCVDTTPPTAPSGLAATVGPSPDMDLAWTASTDSGACSGVIDHYLLYRANYAITSGTDLRTLTPRYVAGNSASYIDSAGAPNTQYWYVMTAVDSSANESGKSNIITKTTAADTMSPAAVADLKATPGAGGIYLAWCKPSDNVGVDHYEIYRKAQATILTDGDIVADNRITSFANAGACLSYEDTGALSGNTYSYAVIAVDGAGNRSTISRGRAAGDTIAAMP